MEEDDEAEIEAEIQRQLDELTEEDVKEDKWTISSLSSEDFARMLENSRPKIEEEDVGDVKLLESVDFYLKNFTGNRDNTQDELIQECNDVLKETEESIEKIKEESKIEEDIWSENNEEIDEETRSELMAIKEKFMAEEEKRRERIERERQEWMEAQRVQEEEKVRREREMEIEREILRKAQESAMMQLEIELEKEKVALDKEQAQHEMEMKKFVQEEEERKCELKELKEYEEKRDTEIKSKAATLIQKIYRGFIVRKLMAPLLEQKRRERICQLEEEKRRKREEEERERLERERRRREEEERKRREEEGERARKEMERKRIEEERRREEERIRREEEKRKREEEEERERKLEEERRRLKEIQARRKEEERRRREVEERKRLEEIRAKEEEERKRLEEMKARKEKEERLRREAEERRRREELKARKEEEERLRREAERKRLEEERKRQEEIEKRKPEYIAAVKIQAIWRGFVTRTVLWPWLPWLQQKAERERRRHEAATKLQANFRGYLLRKRLDDALAAARFEDDDDDFNYDQEIDLTAFNFDEAILEEGWGPSATPQLPSAGPPLAPIETQPRLPPSRLESAQSVQEKSCPPKPMVAWNSSSRLNTPVLPKTETRPPTENSTHKSVLERQAEITTSWGFENTDTAKLMLRRARKLKQGVKMHKKLQDPQTRFALFKKLNSAAEARATIRQPISRQPNKGKQRLSYFQHKAQGNSADSSPDHSVKRERMDLTYRWVHEHFVSQLSTEKSPGETDRRHFGETTPKLPRINLNASLVAKSLGRNT
eukprot:m.5124 g.5124  ORF g.5124 m.5124 type:complete len:784 (+) comp12156_c0_seq1:89-2440(+)